MVFERQIQHHIPVVLFLWRASAVTMQSGTQTGVALIARRAADGKSISFPASAVKRRANKHSLHQNGNLTSSSRGRLPLPNSHQGHHSRASFDVASANQRSISHWSTLRSRLFPALRAVVLPVTTACLAAAAGMQGHHQQPGVVGLHGSRLPVHLPATLSSSSSEGAGFNSAVPADVSTARQLLEARGFMHPGMQPGAAWGAIPPSSSGEMHAMFEYLLLFPA